jgi:hypothetical protein
VSAAPLGADTGGPGAAVPGRWLGVNTRSEDRRKDDRGGYRVPGYRPSIIVRHEGRSGKERRQGGDTLTAPDAPRDAGTGMARGARPRPADVLRDLLGKWCDTRGGWGPFAGGFTDHYPIDDTLHGDRCDPSEAWGCYRCGQGWPCLVQRSLHAITAYDGATDEQRDAEAERWHEGHYPSGVSDPAVVRCDKPPSQCGEYGGTHQQGKPNAFCDCRCHDTIDSAEDIDYESVDYVHSILQAEIDRDLLARAQHPSYRRDEHVDSGVELHSATGVWGQLPDRELAVLGGLSVHGLHVRGDHRATREGGGLLTSGAGPSRAGALRLRLARGRERLLRVVHTLGLWPVKEVTDA